MNDSELLLDTPRFQVVRRQFSTKDGRQHAREVILHPGAVAILPLLDDGRVVLVENFRPSVRQTLIELPAGTLNPGEDPRDAARRELREETGYSAETLEPMPSFFVSPGILHERMHLFLARGLSPGPLGLEPGEQIEPLIVRWQEALAMLRDGRIQDAKTIAGLLLYETARIGRQAPA